MSDRLEDYDFQLPEELIAQVPLEPRDASRLMVIHRKTGQIEHRKFTDLPEYLQSGDLVVANNTRVMSARLLGRRILGDEKNPSGGKIEFLLLEQKEPLVWEGMFHAAAKHRAGLRFAIPPLSGEGPPLVGELISGSSDSPSGTVVARFDRDPLTQGYGQIPLPPYIERNPDAKDSETYQTIYARETGSAAAPTAGLHFTPRVKDALLARGVRWEEITLHVGLGTFRPVKQSRLKDHVMHEERFWIPQAVAEAVARTHEQGHRVMGVGTTSVRALEGASTAQGIAVGPGRTSLFILPGYSFRAVDVLLTNFHLPKSTLLMLVSAFAGVDLIRKAYGEAVAQRYRFFSYGDAMLIL